MWGIIPAAGSGSRIQPLAFSKELLPVGSRIEGGVERPRAVAEYLVERMVLGGVRKICFVISPGKSDIMEYFGGGFEGLEIYYAVQPQPVGLCDAIFRALPLVHPEEPVVIGLPDTIWFPEDALLTLGDDSLSFLLFPVERPHLFDVVLLDESEGVIEVQVKDPAPGSHWVWGAFKISGSVLGELYTIWLEGDRRDEYIGTLVNSYLRRGGSARGVREGTAYVDVGTVDGYREAIGLLATESVPASRVSSSESSQFQRVESVPASGPSELRWEGGDGESGMDGGSGQGPGRGAGQVVPQPRSAWSTYCAGSFSR